MLARVAFNGERGGVAGKKTGHPVGFRIDPDLAAMLAGFVERNPGWSKTEVMSVALYGFLTSGEKERGRLLLSYRSRRAAGAASEKPRGT